MISSTMRTEELLQEVKRSNAELEAQTGRDTTIGEPRPPGSRSSGA
jgi:hypothetical protein